MPFHEFAGFRTPVRVEAQDADGWAIVRFPSGGWLSIHVRDLVFEPGEAPPAAALSRRSLTARQRSVLRALLRHRDGGGLTDAELEQPTGLTVLEVRATRKQLVGLELMRRGLKMRGKAWPYEISVYGEWALLADEREIAQVAG